MMSHPRMGYRKVTCKTKPLNTTVIYGDSAFGHGMYR
jgi:hypothetical protein